MQVSANDQIGRISPTHARAYGARVRTSNRSMNTPFDVSEGSGTVGKINRQYLPTEAQGAAGSNYALLSASPKRPATSPYTGAAPMGANPVQAYSQAAVKAPVNEGGSAPLPSYSEERGVGGDWERAQADFDAYFRNTEPGTVIDFADGKLTMGNDGIARYEGRDYGGNWCRSTSQFSAGDDMAAIATNNKDIRNYWGELYGLGVKAPGNLGWYMPFRADRNNTNTAAWGTTPEMGSTSGANPVQAYSQAAVKAPVNEGGSAPLPSYSEERGVGGDWERAQADFDAYFRNTEPGTVIDFADGKLTMGNDGIARYEGRDYGGNWCRSTSQFSAGDDMAAIATNNKDIRNYWGELYGLGVKAPGNLGWYMPFRADRNNTTTAAWGTTPEMGSTSGYAAYGLPPGGAPPSLSIARSGQPGGDTFQV